MMLERLTIPIVAFGIAAAGPADAAEDQDWPCVQRLVPELSAAQLWSGPPLDEVDGFWQADPEIAPLVLELVDVTDDEAVVQERLDAFIAKLPEEARAERLPMLFLAVLETINGERQDMINVIMRYAERQRMLAERIAEDNARLQGIRVDQAADQQAQELQQVRQRRDWDLRIFDDRFAMLTLICEQPVRLEQRAFALARSIQGRLP